MSVQPKRRLVALDTAGMPPKPGPDFARLADAIMVAEPPKLSLAGLAKDEKE